MRTYDIAASDSWEELGEAGDKQVLAAVPAEFTCFQNVLVHCQHGFDYEEIDLVAIGPTGIWAIEVKNWRGIAYPGQSADELVFVRVAGDGKRTSCHMEDLFAYLKASIDTYFPSPKALVVFAARDRNGRTGVNLDRVRQSNPSLVYLEEVPAVLLRAAHRIASWDGSAEKEALAKLRTWDRIHFTDGTTRRGIICRWPSFDSFKVKCEGKTISVDWGQVREARFVRTNGLRIAIRFVNGSGDSLEGFPEETEIPVQLAGDGIQQILFADLSHIRTGGLGSRLTLLGARASFAV